jgi:hypothetical protein
MVKGQFHASAAFSLYSINLFSLNWDSVYWAVRIESLNVFHASFSLQRLSFILHGFIAC